jgi:hypothetical protein
MAYLTPETKIKNAIIAYCNEQYDKGVPMLCFRRDSASINYRRGLPDMYIIYGAYHIEVETKTPDGELSIDQIKWRDRLTRMGTPYLVARSLQDFKDFLLALPISEAHEGA